MKIFYLLFLPFLLSANIDFYIFKNKVLSETNEQEIKKLQKNIKFINKFGKISKINIINNISIKGLKNEY